MHALYTKTVIATIILQWLSSWACTPNERSTLLSFKAGLTDSQGRLASWQGNGNCCNWKGIGCVQRSNTTHVTALNLRNPKPVQRARKTNGKMFAYSSDSWSLNGTISPLLFSSLKQLEYLDLSWNNFQQSQIPEQLGDLHRLRYLNLSNAGFSDAIPERLSNLSALHALDLSCTTFIVDVSSVSMNMSNHRPVHNFLFSNASSGFLYCHSLSWLERLNALTVLVMEGVDLSTAVSGLKGSIPNLPQLQELYIHGNSNLSVDISQFFDIPWPSLQILGASLCSINGMILSNIANSSSLVELNLQSNNIVGPIPPFLGNISTLNHIDFAMNSLSGSIPSSLSSLGNLQVLNFNQNNLEGQIPDSLCELPISLIDFSYNKLNGSIPNCMSNFSGLFFFDFSYNSLEGAVSLTSLFGNSTPIYICLSFSGVAVRIDQMEMPKFFQPQYLMLASCSIEGTVPNFISKLEVIEVLILQGNNLIGSIPSWLWQLPRLAYLDLSNNHLHGTIPPSFKLAMSIMPSGLNLANNSLQGNLPIPPDIIEVFDLSHNQFSGSIPTQMGERLLNSKYVSFSANQLTGAIPPMFCDGNNVLMNLDLSQNNFTGTIPSTFGNCTALVALNLGENNLTGNVPLELENAKNLKAIRLNNNCLTGVFPKPIQNLKDLEFLNLGYNFFEGSIPLFIGHLSGLRVLVLRSNSFNGSIPTEITQMHQLQFMDLSNNNLEGTIPSNLSSFEALTKQTPAVILGYMIELEALSMNLELVNKGMQLQLTKVYSYYTGIDLSNNHLDGAIPEQIGLLQELFMLNLSRNNLVGQIPRSIGNLTTLGSLDISHNKLSGNIPISLTTLDSLGWVSVSFNNLSGQVPSSPHFETLTLDSLVFEGNPLLCGGSTGKSCNTYHEEGVRGQETEGRRTTWLWYGWLVLSFAIGFWGVFVVLAIKETWWVKYWNTMEDMAVGIMNFFSGYKREVKMQRRHDPLL
ncbi:hypothetical protein AMTRI_Chr03g52730 [Amborella trichopoda]